MVAAASLIASALVILPATTEVATPAASAAAGAPTGSWSEAPRTYPVRRSAAAIAYDSVRDQTLLFGGLKDGTGLNDTWVWADGEWRQRDPERSPAPRYGSGVTYDAARKEVVLFGGSACDGTGCRPVAETWTWDGTTWTHEHPEGSPPPLHAPAMAYDASAEEVVLFGGCLSAACPSPTQTWTWDGTTWTAQLNATAPAPRAGAAMTYDAARDTTVLFGGAGIDGNALADTWTWDGAAWTRMSPATSPPARAFSGMAYDGAHEEVFLFGGSQRTCPTCTQFLDDAWTWDGADWHAVTPMGPPPLEDVSLAYDPIEQQIVLFGGRGKVMGANDIVVGTLRDTWTYDGSAWSKHESTWPEERQQPALVYDPVSRMTLMVGGNCGFDPTCGVWAWDGTTWTKVSEQPRVWQATPAFHPNSQKVVLPFGSAVREWDGACRTWTTVTPAVAPIPRVGFAFAPDRNGNAVMFGGQACGGSCYLNDTWVWDGARWERIDLPRKPTGRAYATMSYDPVRRETVLFGGLKDGRGGFLNDTWTWDGSAWTQRETAVAPAARVFASMSFDPGSDTTMLIGGTDVNNTALSDVWFWDGREWFEGPLDQAPLPRTLAGQAEHAPTGTAIVFGGQRAFIARHQSDTWVWTADGATPEPPDATRECGEPGSSPVPTPPPTTAPPPAARGDYPIAPDDPLVTGQWGPQRIKAPEAWQERRATGHEITVAVLDSGVDLHHEDFRCPGKLKVVRNSDAITGDDDPDDEFGHGTHVAGIIGACTDNSTGIVGTAPDATLLPIRVLNQNGSGNDTQLIRGIDRAVDAGAHVINMSLSFGPASTVLPPEQIGPAIERAAAAGVVVVASAGNDSLPLCEYPGLAEDVICVGATDNRDAKAWYSLFTNKETGPAVVAPGGQSIPNSCTIDSEEILSTYAVAIDEATGDCDDRLGYTDQAGTSMAAPHVAGVAALVYDRLGGARTRDNATKVIDAIVSTAEDLGPPGYDPVFGSGRVDALAAVRAIERRIDTSLSFTERSGTTGQFSDEVLLEARLSDEDGEPLADRAIAFTLSGDAAERVFHDRTDEQGVANVTPRLDVRPGSYQLVVRFDETEEVAGSADQRSFVVDKEDTTTTLVIAGKGNRSLRARLADLDSDEPIAGRTIVFSSDGREISSDETGLDGWAASALPPRERGAHHLYEARFEGDDLFLGSSGEATGKAP